MVSDRLLIMIPAYNEAGNIESVIERLREEASFADLLVIDDGSDDDTAAVCRKLQVRVASHRVNLGLSEAIRTGMKYAIRHGYDYCMQFDADGQHDETAIMTMLRTAKEQNAGIVIGSRFIEEKRGLGPKGFGSRLISACIRLCSGAAIKDPTSGMRLYDRSVMEKYTASTHFAPEPDMLCFFARQGVGIAEISVKARKRRSGRSYLDVTGSVSYMFRMCASILFLQWMR